MTQQEQQMLQGLIQRVNQTRLDEKDPDAEEMLQHTLGRNPDALYILSQTVLVQQYALEQAQKQLADLRSQQQQQQALPRHSTSFLGALLGRDEQPRPSAPPPPPQQYASQPQFTPVPGYTPVPPAQPSFFGGPSGGGFLRGAAQTAAGVAAGALAFEGIESLLHGFGHGPGFGSFNDRPEVINNYYEDSPREHGEHNEHLSPDIEDRRGDTTFSKAVDDNDHGDQLMQKDSDPSFDNDDDSQGDDSGGDFGGGDFDSGGSDDNSF
jgi:hypothetical protein